MRYYRRVAKQHVVNRLAFIVASVLLGSLIPSFTVNLFLLAQHLLFARVAGSGPNGKKATGSTSRY